MDRKSVHDTITIMSAINTLLVIFIHAYYVNQWFGYPNNGVTLFAEIMNRAGYFYAVQFFFLLSGFLLFSNLDWSNLKNKLTRRIHTLIIPYLLWNIIGFGFLLLTVFLGVSDEKIDNSIIAIIWGIVTYKYMSHFWYIAWLIIFVAFTPLILLLFIRTKTVFATVVITILAYLVSNLAFNYQIPYIGTEWFVWYIIGCALGRMNPDLLYRRMGNKEKLIIPLCVIICVVLELMLPVNIVARLVLGGAVYYGVWKILIELNARRGGQIPGWVKKGFLVYAAHGMVCSTLSKVTWYIVSDSILGQVLTYGMYFAGIPVILAGDLILMKLFPKAREVLLGGRG